MNEASSPVRPPPSPRTALPAHLWTLLAASVSVAVCSAITWLHYDQETAMRQSKQLLTDLRDARLDLARGFLHLSLASDAQAPFRQEDGLALISQAIEDMRLVEGPITSGMSLNPRDAALVRTFESRALAFREQLSVYNRTAPENRPGMKLPLTLAFHDLELLAQRVDYIGQGALNALSDRLDARFRTTLVAAMMLLGAICLVVYFGGRRQQAADRSLYMNRERLEASESRFRALFEQAAVGVAEIETGTGRFLRVNQRYGDIVGYGPAEMAELDFQRITHPDDLPADLRQMERLKAGAIREFTMEKRYVRRDGAVVWAELTVSPLWPPGAAPTRHVAVIQDITARKQAEDDLQTSERQFRAFVENAPDAIFIQTRGCFAYVNPAATRLFGATSARQLLGTAVIDRIHPDFHARVAERIRRLNVDRQPVDSAVQSVLRCDGTRIEAEFSAVPFEYGGESGALVFGRNVTERLHAEAALAAEATRRRILIEGSRDGIVVLDQQGRVIEANRRFAEMLGYTTDEVLDLHVWDWDRDWPRERVLEAIRSLGPEGASFETRHWRKDGTCFDVELSNSVADLAGQKLVFCVCHDITARKQAGEALRQRLELQDRFARIATTVPGMICSFRLAPDGSMSMPFATAVIEDIYGLRPEDVREDFSRALAVVHPEDREKLRAGIIASARDLSPWQDAFRILHPQKGERWVEGHSVPRREPDGGVLWHGFVQDVTARQQADVALRESELRFRSLIEAAPEAIYVQSDGVFLFVNRAMVHLMGAGDAGELVGQDIFARIAPECQAQVRERIRRQRETGTPVGPVEQTYLRLDGARVPVESTAAPFKFQGRDGHLVFIRDITVRRKAVAERASLEEQLRQAQKMESVGRLAGGVAHDFNNLLMGIMGHADLCREKIGPSNPACAHLDEVINAARRSAAITRQLLAFARKQTIAPVVMDLNAQVEGSLKLLRRLIGEDIDIAWLPQARHPMVTMDPSQVDQILVNLVVNARDAIAGVGKITIETGDAALDAAFCGTHAGATPGDYVLLAVSDTGCGMSAETIVHIFEPFFTTKPVGTGTGLGLATVYGIVKQNRGYVYVYSEPGNGATFRVYLPREAAPVTAPDESPDFRNLRGTESLLLVEDEGSVRDVTCAFLKGLGYAVASAASPAEALRLAARLDGSLALLITDVILPGMNGRDLAAQLMAARPGLQCLFMSGYTASAIEHHGVLEPGVNFIAKPVTREQLARKVRDILDARTASGPGG